MRKLGSRTAMVLALIFSANLSAQFGPEDVFREYYWTCPDCDAGNSLRVGEHDYTSNTYNDAYDLEIGQVDLEHAIRAEAYIEKIQCHDRTDGLQIQVNDNSWYDVPYPDDIPDPQDEYMHHIYPVVEIPLSDFIVDGENVFRFRIKPELLDDDWSQNLLEGVTFRIYYDAEKKAHPQASITAPAANSALGTSVELTIDISDDSNIKQVDYLHNGEDINWEGDGIYRQWHFIMEESVLKKNIGSAATAPFSVTWDTEWVPSQNQTFSVAARVVDNTNLVYVTPAVSGLCFSRTNNSVELCKPYDVEPKWVTRKGTKSEHFDVEGDLSKASAIQVHWKSWAGSYCSGVKINGTDIGCGDGGKRYDVGFHLVDVSSTDMLQTGQNELSIDGSGGGSHGMEVQWPGPMVLVKYNKDEPACETSTTLSSLLSEAQPRGIELQRLDRDLMVVHNPLSVGAELDVCAPNGAVIASNIELATGTHRISLPNDLLPGMYLLRIRTREGVVKAEKMLTVK